MAKKENKPLSITLQLVDRVSKVAAKVDKALDKISLKSFRGDLKALSDATGFDRIHSSMLRIGRATRRTSREMFSLGKRASFFALAAGGGAFAMVKSFANAGENLALTSSKLGLSTKNIQAWRFAAEKADISATTFDTALQRLGRRTGEFTSTGKGTAAPAFEALGISSDIASGKLTKLNDLYPVIIDRLGEITDANERNAVAMKLFDTEGVKLVNLAIDGSKGLRELSDRFEQLGGAISDDAIQSTVRFNSKLVDSKAAIGGVRNIFAEKLLPIVEQLMEKFTALITNNKANIVVWADKLAEKLKKLPSFVKTLRGDFHKFLETIKPVVSFIEKIIEKFGVFNTVATVIGVFVLAPLIASIVSLIASLSTLFFHVTRVSLIIGGTMLPVFKKLISIIASLKVVFAPILILVGKAVKIFTVLAVKIAAVVAVFASFFKMGKKIGEFIANFDPLNKLLSKVIQVTDKIKVLKKSLDFFIEAGNKIDRGIDKVFNKAQNLLGFGGKSEPKVVKRVINQRSEKKMRGDLNIRFSNPPPGMRAEVIGAEAMNIGMNLGFQ